MKCFFKALALLFFICWVSLIQTSEIKIEQNENVFMEDEKLKLKQDENVHMEYEILKMQLDDTVCMKHAEWVLENQNHPDHDWKNYLLKNVQDARLWLACYEPQTCRKNFNDNCANLQKKNNPNIPNNMGRVYKLSRNIYADNFLDNFDVAAERDYTNGVSIYVNKDKAYANNLISTPTNNGKKQFRINVGNVENNGRLSIKLRSKVKYNGGLFVFDSDHAPEGKGVWPAYWMTGESWPCDGEIDIFEYVNSVDYNTSENHFTLHTRKSCTQDGIPGISNGGNCGAARDYSNQCNPCGRPGSTDCAYAGCGFSQGRGTGGNAFNNNGGGVYVTEWIKEGEIKMWFFTHNEAKNFLVETNNSLDTSKWPAPLKYFKACPGTFNNLNIIINTALCGDWATPDFQNKGWGDCPNYVRNPANRFDNAYWLINSLKIYN